jgi:hypothetical protein
VAEVQDPVPQGVAGLYELAPRLGADHAVHEEVPTLLECPDLRLRGGPEHPLELSRIDAPPQRHEALLDVADVISSISGADGPHGSEYGNAAPHRQADGTAGL